MVDVSVIIINYNTFDFTLQCVRSVLEKTKDVSLEIVIVDNASQYFDADAFGFVSSGLRIIRNESNVGFAKANNIGIKASTGETILLLNNDTSLINDAISLSYKKLCSRDEIGVVGCKLLNADFSWQRSFFNFPTISDLLKRLFRVKPDPVHFDKVQVVDWVSGAFFMFRRKDLTHFKDFALNQDYFMYCEDIKWCRDFKRNNLNTLYFPEGEVVHYQGKSYSANDAFSKKTKFYFPNLRHYLNSEYGFLYSRLYFLFLVILYASDFKRNSFKDRLWPLIKIGFRGY